MESNGSAPESAGGASMGMTKPHQLPGDTGGINPSQIGLRHSDSPTHVSISSQPPHSVPESCSSTGRLLPGRQRILASAARQLAASELLVEGLDVCAVDINTHALPPPSSPSLVAQREQEGDPSASSHRKHTLELLRLHALLQAAVGEEQDLVVVGLHQVATQYRHEWAACVAAAFAAADGQALTAIRTHLLGPEASTDTPGAATGGAAAAPRTASFTNYEQIVPLDACPHHNQLLLVYVHPSHLHKVTLLSIAKSRLGSYCCRDLQHNYKQQWDISAAGQKRLRQQWEEQRKQQQLQQQQQRLDLFFNFNNFFVFSDSTPTAGMLATNASVPGEGALSRSESQADSIPRTPLGPLGLSRPQRRRQRRIYSQRLKDRICCSNICSVPQCTSRCGSTPVHSVPSGSSNETRDCIGKSGTAACGCELYKEVFAYGGMAARLLIGATPVVVACVDLKLNEDQLEHCGRGLSCRFCREHHEIQPTSTSAAATERGVNMDALEGAGAAEKNAMSVAWRKQVTRALQRQQLLTILADLRFETDSGWASALELKPLLLLGGRRQRGLSAAPPFLGSRGSAGAGAKRVEGVTMPSNELGSSVAVTEQQLRLKELEQLGVSTVEDNRFFFCCVPRKAGGQALSLTKSGRAAEWRRPAWNRMGDDPGLGVVVRFWLKWMSCRLLVESVDTDRVKKQCNDLRRTLRQGGRCLSKLLVDPPLLQLPPVRPFEPMQLKICLSNPHESLPTAYAVYCLSDSGKSIVPLSHVSYWHGALWRRWESTGSEDQSISATGSRGTDFQPTAASHQQQERQRELLQHEQQRLQDEALREAANGTQDPSRNKNAIMPGDGAFAVVSEADAKTALRRRIRLERWLLMDSLHGFLKGGETRVVSMTLNIQEGIYSPRELACGVLVLRLVDSRQDFFCCLAASLMPALLGAELHPLAMLGGRSLLPGTVEDSRDEGQGHEEHDALDDKAESSASTRRDFGISRNPKDGSDSEENVQDSESQLPLPKELWWLLMHLHAKIEAAAIVALESSRQECHVMEHTKSSNARGWEEHKPAESCPLRTENSFSSKCSMEGIASVISSGDSSQSDGDNSSSSGCTQGRQLRLGQAGGCNKKGGLGFDVAVFLCTAGGETLTWPSFLAGADTYLQPQQQVLEFAGAAGTGEDPRAFEEGCASSSSSRGRKQRHTEGTNRGNYSSTEESVANCESELHQPLKRDVAFSRACLERGIAIPEGVSLCAALLLLEEWGATCCFFPSEFAVQDVQTDNLHLLCRAILLSLPSVHRNAFISVVSCINELLRAAGRSLGSCSRAPGMQANHQGQREYRPPVRHPGSSGTSNSSSSAADTVSTTEWVGCCTTGAGTKHAECNQICLEVLKSGERGSPAQRVNCLESLDTPQLLRHALLLWTGAWLMKSCRPALRHAVLDHFITPV